MILRVKDLMRFYNVSEATAKKLKREILENSHGCATKKHVTLIDLCAYEGISNSEYAITVYNKLKGLEVAKK